MNAFTSSIRFAAIAALALAMNAAIGQTSSGAPPATARDGGGAGAGAMPPASAPATSTSRAAGMDQAGKTAGDAAGKTVSSSDKKMMRELAQANIAEIDTAKLAQEKTKNPDVQAFAKKMIDDHTQASNELTQLAQSKGVTLPEKPDSKHQAMAAKLGKLSGQQFDKQYMANAGVADHRTTIALLKRIRSKATDPELKALAEKLLPTVEQHLSMAQSAQPKK